MKVNLTDDEVYGLTLLAHCFLTGQRPVLTDSTIKAVKSARKELLAHAGGKFTDTFLQHDDKF